MECLILDTTLISRMYILKYFYLLSNQLCVQIQNAYSLGAEIPFMLYNTRTLFCNWVHNLNYKINTF